MTHPIGPARPDDGNTCAQVHACDVCGSDYQCTDPDVSLVQYGEPIACPDPAHPEHRQELTACGTCSGFVSRRDSLNIGVRLRMSTKERELRRERQRLLMGGTVVPVWARRAEMAAQGRR